MTCKAALFAILVALPAAAAGHPDLSGVWELQTLESRFDRQAPPEKVVDLFVYKDPELEINSERTEQGETSKGTLKYRTEGAEGVNEVKGNLLKYSAGWYSSTLVITTWGKFGGNEIKLIDRYSLSADKNRLTLMRRYEGRGGPQEQVLLFDRQKPR